MAVTYEPIQSTTLSSAAADVTLSSIPGTFTDLVLVVQASVSNNANGGGARLRINSDSGSNYSFTRLYGDGSSAASYRRTNVTEIAEILNGSPGAPRPLVFHFLSYSNTSVNKTVLHDAFVHAGSRIEKSVALWRSTAAITSLYLAPSGAYNFESGSTFSLYGIKAA